MISTQKERLSDKCIILKGKFIVTTEEIHKGLAAAEKKTKKTRVKKGKRRAKLVSAESEMEVVDVLDDLETEEREIEDCIAVQLS